MNDTDDEGTIRSDKSNDDESSGNDEWCMHCGANLVIFCVSYYTC
jgi:hypothetical protein